MKCRIKELRKTLKLTQAEFGERLELTNNYIYMIEQGKAPISDKLILSICNVFHVNKGWLETGDGEMFTPQKREEKIAELSAYIYNMKDLSVSDENQLIELLKIVVDLSPDQQALLLDVAKNFNNGKDIPSH